MKPFLWIASVAIASARLLAAPLSVGDPSFEGNALNAGQWNDNLSPEWQETNGPNNGNAFEEFITGFAADGTDHLGMNLGQDVWQDLPVTYQPNTRYTLTVAAGNRSGSTQPGNQTYYVLADSTGAVYATGIFNASSLPGQSFADAPDLVFDTPTNASAVGKNIRILLQARGSGRSHFDNIRLDATSLVPPGGALLVNAAATSVTTATATLNGEVTDIGADAPSVTLFWGDEDGGLNPAGWDHSETLAGTYSGAFSTAVSGLQPGTTYFFTSRATNSAGESWAFSPESFTTAPLPPEVANVAASGVGATTATVGAAVTSTGGEDPTVTIYYGPDDGGTDAGNWASSVNLGSSGGLVSTVLGSLSGGTTYHFRAFAQNSGGSAWAPVSSSFTTLVVTPPAVENRSAEGMTGSTASLRGEVTATGNDAPAVTVFYGTADGGTVPANWPNSVALGPQAGEFSAFVAGLAPETTYYFRSRAVNAAGTAWAADTFSFTTTPPVPDTAVIHEFHFNPADDTSLEEFIELHNPGANALDLSGWTLSDAVAYTFPPGTTLPAGGYLVVAENPATLLAKYGTTALGPWTGKLNSTGERIDLRDGGGLLKDRVNYGVGFPWPTGPDGGGSSAELLNPGLDNDLGGSWRASGAIPVPATTYVAASASGWKYRKGTSEASSPNPADWRTISFNDSSWSTGATPIGIGQTSGTPLTDMVNGGTLNYQSVYARKTFTVPANQIPAELILRVLVDDACVVWINGTEVYRTGNAGSGQLAYNFNPGSGVNGTPTNFTTINLSNTSFVFGGTNVLAIHAFNRNTNFHRGDFLFNASLESPAGTANPVPTPGAANSVASATGAIPPQIRQVNHFPTVPAPGEAVTVTARITDPDGMGPVSLAYQTVDPGSYIRLTDAAYATSWTTVPMADNGTGGDVAAGDGTFTAVLPAGIQTNRRLVRYRITFADAIGNSATVPYADDEQPNFAYYVYSGLPDWQGAFRPGSTPLQTFPASVLDDVPVYTLVANGTDVINSQYNGGSDATRFRGTFVYDGRVYDHIEYRNRGEASTYVSGKNKWRFFFNRARDLPAKNNFGEDYAETWGSFSGDACASPWAAVHRGMAGVEEAASYKMYQLAGLPSPHTHYYHFRVVRGATETLAAGTSVNDPIGNADGQYAGDFWGLYLAVEQPDGSFLDERGLPDGNVYKIENNAGDKKNQAAGQPVDSSDWNSFRDTQINTNPSEAWWRANMDMDAYYTFHALNRLNGNVDLRYGFNHNFYHRSSDGRWVPVPWDLDMMFIAKSHWSGIIHANKSIEQNPALALEYRNRAREILDLMGADGTPGGGQIGQLIDEFAAIVNPAGQPLTWADADAAMWNLHPRTQGSDSSANGQTNHRGNFFRTSFLDDRIGGSWTRWLRTPASSGTMEHEDSMVYLRDYATDTWPGGTWSVNNGEQRGYGHQYLLSDSFDAAIPDRPVVTALGDPAFPVTDLVFTASAFADPQGAGSYGKTQWRLAEISGPGVPGYEGGPRKYEMSAIWSTETTDPATPVTIPNGVATAGRTYRVRVRHQDDTGRWSRWSEAAQFAATTPPPGLLMHYWNFNDANPLVVTETTGGAVLTPVLSGSAAVVFDSGQSFAGENARNGDAAGTHLRANNPLTATLDFAVPTTGYEDIVVRYETRRSGQGAGQQDISYTIDGSTWIPLTTVTVVDGPPVLQVLDFRNIAAASDNPLFRIRIAFTQAGGGTGGNNRFDNFTVEGSEIPLAPGTYAYWRDQHFDGADLLDDLVSGPEASAAGDGIANILRYAHGVGPYDEVLHLLPAFAKDAGGAEFRFRFDPSLTDLVWRVKASSDLDAWSYTLFDSATDPIPPLEDGWLPVAVPDSLSGDPQPDERAFLRLEVELAE
jgi:hypothetical protein